MKKIFLSLILLLMLGCGIVWGGSGNFPAPPELNCRAAVLMDYDTGAVLYQKNAGELIPPASMTKLMTMYLVIEKINAGELSLDDVFTVSSRADFRSAPAHSSLMFLEKGQKLTVGELLSGLAVCSGNDSAVAAAELVADSAESFVELMNAKAKELGLESLHFTDASGFDDKNVVNSMDFCKFCRIFIRDCSDYFPSTVSLDSFTYPKTRNLNGNRAAYGGMTQINNNDLLGRVCGVDGLKTGFIDESGYNVALSAHHDGMNLVAVIMGVMSPKQTDGRMKRLADGTALLTYGFSVFRTFVPELPELKAPVPGGKCAVRCGDGGKITVPYCMMSDIEYHIHLEKNIPAPSAAGTKAGTCTVTMGDRTLGEVDLILADDVAECPLVKKFTGIFTKPHRKSAYDFVLRPER
ncbi:MAG: D-alanyl-D-alanine carboxypeptidase [Spirochaetia bacterium]|nr:D-alanyl-D-alanine carboxypeptidase [Spirochaetia bacterium]